MTAKDVIIKVSTGCVDYLTSEVDRLRREMEILRAEKRVMDNMFSMINRLGDLPKQGFEEDKLWQAKREIENSKTAVGVEERLNASKGSTP